MPVNLALLARAVGLARIHHSEAICCEIAHTSATIGCLA
jgi:hypothetical protein